MPVKVDVYFLTFRLSLILTNICLLIGNILSNLISSEIIETIRWPTSIMRTFLLWHITVADCDLIGVFENCSDFGCFIGCIKQTTSQLIERKLERINNNHTIFDYWLTCTSESWGTMIVLRSIAVGLFLRLCKISTCNIEKWMKTVFVITI